MQCTGKDRATEVFENHSHPQAPCSPPNPGVVLKVWGIRIVWGGKRLVRKRKKNKIKFETTYVADPLVPSRHSESLENSVTYTNSQQVWEPLLGQSTKMFALPLFESKSYPAFHCWASHFAFMHRF